MAAGVPSEDDALMQSAAATTVSAHRFSYPVVKPLPPKAPRR